MLIKLLRHTQRVSGIGVQALDLAEKAGGFVWVAVFQLELGALVDLFGGIAFQRLVAAGEPLAAADAQMMRERVTEEDMPRQHLVSAENGAANGKGEFGSVRGIAAMDGHCVSFGKDTSAAVNVLRVDVGTEALCSEVRP